MKCRTRSTRIAAAALSAFAVLGTAGCSVGGIGLGPDRPSASVPAPAPPAPLGTAPAPVVINPVVPGWSPVRSVLRGAVYDVPPTWKVRSEGTVVGFGPANGGPPWVAASGAAGFGEDACGGSGSSLALAGVKHDTGTELVGPSTSVAADWAQAAYRDPAERTPRLSYGAPETITTVEGQSAVVTKVTATPTAPTGPCHTTRGAAYAVAATGFTGRLGPTVILVIVVDEKLTGANPVPEAQIRQVLSTLRPAPPEPPSSSGEVQGGQT